VTALVWDKPGDRRFVSGFDRGVLYTTDGNVDVWNGLVSVVESFSRDVKSSYMDGVKYQDYAIPGDYTAKLTAFTYPDTLDLLMGNAEFAPGITVYDQPSKMFHLSYRTGVGNDLQALEYGYRIHIVYNVTAVLGDVTDQTISETPTPASFEWDLHGSPTYLDGFRATNHISIDSKKIDPIALTGLEHILYGTDETAPHLPAIGDLLDMIS
jgi:hypothetical protein